MNFNLTKYYNNKTKASKVLHNNFHKLKFFFCKTGNIKLPLKILFLKSLSNFKIDVKISIRKNKHIYISMFY